MIKACLGRDVAMIPALARRRAWRRYARILAAELKRGVDIVIEATGLDSHVKDADLVITGEGRIDGQTIYGKTPMGVAKTAKRYECRSSASQARLRTGMKRCLSMVSIWCSRSCPAYATWTMR